MLWARSDPVGYKWHRAVYIKALVLGMQVLGFNLILGIDAIRALTSC